jgi:hypothetical protein
VTPDLWLLLIICLIGLVRVHVERYEERLERRAKQINGDYADYAESLYMRGR